MKVLHVVNAASTGGAQTLIENLARVQSEDIDTTILVILGEDDLSERFAGVAEVVHLGMSTRTVRLDKVARAIRSLASHVSADVLHSHLLQADLACLVANRQRSVPHVSTVHTTGMTQQDPLKSRLIGRAVGRSSKRFDAAVACSTSAIEYMDAMGYVQSNRVVISNGVPVAPDCAPRERAGRAPFFLSLSRWHPMKDHRTLFAAFATVASRFPDTRLVCAGNGMTHDNHELVELLRASGVATAVDLLGPVADVAPLLRQSMASVISSSYGEALPMAGLESISAGVPLVGTSVGEVSNLVIDDRLLVPPANPVALAAALRHVIEMDDAAYAKACADSHTQALEAYDVRVTARLYREVYDRVAR